MPRLSSRTLKLADKMTENFLERRTNVAELSTEKVPEQTAFEVTLDGINRLLRRKLGVK